MSRTPAMKRARVAFLGAMHDAVAERGRLRLADGRLVDESAVVWLPPLPETPRPAHHLFGRDQLHRQGARTRLQGARGARDHDQGARGARRTRRRDAPSVRRHVHATTRASWRSSSARRRGRVTRTDAYEYVQGYAVANAYVVRDYLDDDATAHPSRLRPRCLHPDGPWLVDAADIRDPMNLRLRTLHQRRHHAAGKHARHGLRTSVPDRVPQLVHDASRGRRDPDRKLPDGSSACRRATRSSPKSTAWVG